jgi:hypothetical protein
MRRSAKNAAASSTLVERSGSNHSTAQLVIEKIAIVTSFDRSAELAAGDALLEDSHDDGLGVASPLPRLLESSGARGAKVVHCDSGLTRRLGGHPEVHREHLAQLLASRQCRVLERFEDDASSRRVATEDLGEQLVLARDVAVQAAGEDSDLVRDVADAGPVVALLTEQWAATSTIAARAGRSGSPRVGW